MRGPGIYSILQHDVDPYTVLHVQLSCTIDREVRERRDLIYHGLNEEVDR